jgi:hypothetical protein
MGCFAVALGGFVMVSSPAFAPQPQPFNGKWVQLAHTLDHAAPIQQWHNRVPALVYPALFVGKTALDVAKAPPEDRQKTLTYDGITLGLPAIATVLATKFLMAPDAAALPTTQAAFAHSHLLPLKPDTSLTAVVQATDEQLAQRFNAMPVWQQRLFWGKQAPALNQREPLLTRLQQQPEALLDTEVVQLATNLRLAQRGQVTPADLHNLHHVATQALAERANNLTSPNAELPQADWPERLKETWQRLGWWDAPKETPLPAQATKDAFKQQLRLLLPVNESFELPVSVASHGLKQGLQAFKTHTVHDFRHEAVPFFITGLASIGSGVVAGWLANRVTHQPHGKDRDVAKEGIFQFVANVCMCAVGATVGMGAANLLGFNKYQHPVARLTTIMAGLAGGIVTGAATANTLSNGLDSVLNALGHKGRAAHAAKGDDIIPERSRHIAPADIVLHFDDIPTAFAVAGMQILKPWIPPFFYLSAIRTAQGFRNGDELERVTPAKTNDKKHAMPKANADKDTRTRTHDKKGDATPMHAAMASPAVLNAQPMANPFALAQTPQAQAVLTPVQPIAVNGLNLPYPLGYNQSIPTSGRSAAW